MLQEHLLVTVFPVCNVATCSYVCGEKRTKPQPRVKRKSIQSEKLL